VGDLLKQEPMLRGESKKTIKSRRTEARNCYSTPGKFRETVKISRPQYKCGPYAQGQDDQRVLSIISSLQDVIPLVEQIDEGADEATAKAIVPVISDAFVLIF